MDYGFFFVSLHPYNLTKTMELIKDKKFGG